MISSKIKKGNRLFWKIASVFTALLIVLGMLFAWLANRFSQSYYTAAHQELYKDIAQHLATFTQPIKNGKPDTSVTHDIIHSTMVANPSVEVYLLDTAGNITDYVVPDTTVRLHKVNLSLVKQWLSASAMQHPLGDNPKQPDEPSIFSAAPVYENQQLTGYVYAVLSSEKQKEILQPLSRFFYWRMGVFVLGFAFLTAFILGVITFLLITRSVREIMTVVKRFKEGDYEARITAGAGSDLGTLGSTFNEMADVIVADFDKITATDRFRQELIANVSHDLRTPLSIMQGYTETLLMKKDQLSESDEERYLTVVHASVRKLSLLVDQLFHYAKLEANLVTPEKESFDIGDLASDILMAYKLKASERGIDLKIEATPNLPSVFADIALTERVLQNLLDNAFKYTEAGGSISIQLSGVSSGVRVQVIDTGVGIAPEDHAYIFERNRQLDNADHSKHGMGIGLAIVKKILELHQSTIDVTSELGKGAAFRFILPTPVKFAFKS